MTRQCQECLRSLSSDNFYANERYIAKTCRDCQRRRVRRSRDKVVSRRPSRAKEPTRVTPGGMSGLERRAFWHQFKLDSGCSDCGGLSLLEFDHLPEFPKHFNISEAVRATGKYSDGEIAAEVRKCEVVCRSCHQARTNRRRAAMDDHGYDQAACRRAAELLRDQAEQVRDAALDTRDTGLREALGAQSRAYVSAALWLEERV